jgi:hypothetical protein
MINIISVKHGSKYGSIYVNKLHNMVRRHLDREHQFVCFTEDTKDLDRDIKIINLPQSNKISGWWWKTYIFKKDHFPETDINLFFDLDMVVISDISKLIDYMPGKFVGLEDLGRAFRPNPRKLGSAVMRWPAGQYSRIWEVIESDPLVINRFRGDQDLIWKMYEKEINFFPRDWIISYKWEARQRSEMIKVGNRYNFKNVRNPDIPKDTSVLAFHGSPDPHEVRDPIIVDNWR